MDTNESGAQTVNSAGYRGIRAGAFRNRLKVQRYDGNADGEIVTETWYRLSFEDARHFIADEKKIGRTIERGSELPDPWVKLITVEHKNTTTGETRRHWLASLRPYVQGYGCDGSTDPNIHAIANRLAEQHGIDYLAVMARSYPGDFSGDSAFSGLIDEDVLAETIIPEVIDVDLALQDLREINNYSLAMELGIELYRAGATATDWVKIREDQELLQQRVECDLDAWFKDHPR